MIAPMSHPTLSDKHEELTGEYQAIIPCLLFSVQGAERSRQHLARLRRGEGKSIEEQRAMTERLFANAQTLEDFAKASTVRITFQQREQEYREKLDRAIDDLNDKMKKSAEEGRRMSKLHCELAELEDDMRDP